MAISISLANGSEPEVKTRERLLALLERYDLSKWEFTCQVCIDGKARIPYSHPVLTLNTRHVNDDAMLLATYLHEQLHWFVSGPSWNAAIKELRGLYPSVPVGGSEGARNQYSTYLHLIVCYLEYKALIELLGADEARRVLERKGHYKWIYASILRDYERIGEIVSPYSTGLT